IPLNRRRDLGQQPLLRPLAVLPRVDPQVELQAQQQLVEESLVQVVVQVPSVENKPRHHLVFGIREVNPLGLREYSNQIGDLTIQRLVQAEQSIRVSKKVLVEATIHCRVVFVSANFDLL